MGNYLAHNNQPVFKTIAMDSWVIATIVGATTFGLLLASLLGITITNYRRNRKQLKRRQHLLLRKSSTFALGHCH